VEGPFSHGVAPFPGPPWDGRRRHGVAERWVELPEPLPGRPRGRRSSKILFRFDIVGYIMNRGPHTDLWSINFAPLQTIAVQFPRGRGASQISLGAEEFCAHHWANIYRRCVTAEECKATTLGNVFLQISRKVACCWSAMICDSGSILSAIC